MRSFLIAAVGLLGAGSAVAQPEAEPLLDEVKQAYRQTRQYAADVHFAIEQQRGRWHTLQDTIMPLAFDRDARRLLLDRPDMRVVVGGGSLKLESQNVPGRYLDLPVEDAPVGPGAPPIRYTRLVEDVRSLGDPPFPTLAFLLEEDPVAALAMGAAGEVEALPPAEGDDLARPRLRFGMLGQTITLTIDPATKLIARSELEVATAMLGGDADDFMRYTFDHRVTAHNQALPAETFAFEPRGREAVATLQALVAPPNADELQRARGGAAEGKPTPPLVTTTLAGEPFDLADQKAKVVVLDFWATWCGPCEGGLTELHKVQAWAEAEGKDVAFFAVNLAERPDQIRRYWEDHGFTMPIVMDPRGEVAAAWGVEGIPASFIVEGGAIRKAHVGFAPGQSETFKQEIEALLAEGAAAASE